MSDTSNELVDIQECDTNTVSRVEAFQAFDAQTIFYDAVMSGKYNYLLMAGDIRSGKTLICLWILVIFCRVFPGSRWVVIRKDVPTLRRNTLPTFFKHCCPAGFFRNYNKSDGVASFVNGSQIIFLSEQFSDDPLGQRFLGLEINGAFFDQIEECQKNTFDIARSRIGQWMISPMPPVVIIATANPSEGWVKECFHDPFVAGELSPPYYFQEADVSKNPYIDKAFITLLEKTWPSALTKRFLRRQWESQDTAWQLVPWEAIYEAKGTRPTTTDRLYMGVDVGRQGADPTIWTIINDNNIVSIQVKDKTDIDEAYDLTRAIIVSKNIDPARVCIDCVGLGAGVGDFLYNRDGWPVIRFFGSASGNGLGIPNSNFKFSNLRTLSNWVAADAIKSGSIGGITSPKLISEIGAIRYGINNDKEIYIMSKEEFKAKMHRSSDYWDSLCYALWARDWEKYTPTPGMFSL